MARLLYGSGMRLMECVRLRVKDVDFGQNQIVVREGKGFKDRVTVLPQSLKLPLSEHLQRVKILHEQDLAAGYGRVYLPYGRRGAAGRSDAGFSKCQWLGIYSANYCELVRISAK